MTLLFGGSFGDAANTPKADQAVQGPVAIPVPGPVLALDHAISVVPRAKEVGIGRQSSNDVPLDGVERTAPPRLPEGRPWRL